MSETPTGAGRSRWSILIAVVPLAVRAAAAPRLSLVLLPLLLSACGGGERSMGHQSGTTVSLDADVEQCGQPEREEVLELEDLGFPGASGEQIDASLGTSGVRLASAIDAASSAVRECDIARSTFGLRVLEVCIDAPGMGSQVAEAVVRELVDDLERGRVTPECREHAHRVLLKYCRTYPVDPETLLALFLETPPELGHALGRWLARSGSVSERILETALERLRSGGPADRRRALELLADLGTGARAAHELVRAALDDEDPDLVCTALETLARLGPLDRDVVLRVLELTDALDAPANLSGYAAEALAHADDSALPLPWRDIDQATTYGKLVRLHALHELSPLPPQAWEVIRAVASGADHWAGLDAARLVWELSGDLGPLTTQAQELVSPDLRSGGALRILQNLHGVPVCEGVDRILRFAARHDDEFVRSVTVGTLVTLQGDVRGLLGEWKNDGDPDLVDAASQALSRLGS